MSFDLTNEHGLRRSDLRDSDRRILRQECGFGCVVCGSALYEYAHIDPPFRDALTHDVSRMALLCPNHHDQLDKWKRLSATEVMRARANPAAKRNGAALDHFACSTDEFVLTIGDVFFHNCHRILQIDGTDVLRIDPPESPGGPHRIFAIFCDQDGALVANIVDNEITYRSATWDVEVAGPNVVFRSGPGAICLGLKTLPGRGLRVERLDMSWAGTRVVCSNNTIAVSGIRDSTLSLRATSFQNCEHCIRVVDGVASVGNLTGAGSVEMIGCLVRGRR